MECCCIRFRIPISIVFKPLGRIIQSCQLERALVSPADFFDLNKQNAAFAAVAAYQLSANMLKTGSGAEMVRTVHVSPSFFQVLSGKPAQGRLFLSENNTAVISEVFWKTRLAATPDVIGKKLSFSTGSATIVGVMPDEFDYPLGTEVWLPLLLNPADAQRRATHDLAILGLLKPGVSPRQAAAELASLSARLAAEFPSTNADEAFALIPLQDQTEGTTNRFIAVILGAASFVLLLACANIGNLQLARATNRLKEIAVRAALGASRYQIARHLLAESLLLSIAAGFLGVLLADWNNYYVKQSIPGLAFRIVPGLRTMNVTPAVLFFAFLIAIMAGIVCSLPAIVHLTRRSTYDNLDESLRERAAISSQHSSGVFRGTLVVSELALALVLLSGAGLMVGSFRHFQNLDQGFNPKNVLIASVSLPAATYADATRRLAYFDRALTSLSAVPAASSAALSADLGNAPYFAIEGRPERRSGEPLPGVLAVSGQYLRSLRIPLIEGRESAATDGPLAPRVIVLSHVFAHFYWPNSSPIGQRIKLKKGGEWVTVVGVAADVVDDWFTGKPSSRVYVPYTQAVPNDVRFIVRTNANPLAVAMPVRAQLQVLDPAVPLLDLNSMVQSLAEERAGVAAAAQAMADLRGDRFAAGRHRRLCGGFLFGFHADSRYWRAYGAGRNFGRCAPDDDATDWRFDRGGRGRRAADFCRFDSFDHTHSLRYGSTGKLALVRSHGSALVGLASGGIPSGMACFPYRSTYCAASRIACPCVAIAGDA